MLKIRLARIGKKKQPYYRIIISEQARDTYGRVLEILGSYDPRSKKIGLKNERIKYWLSQGAAVSPTMHNLLITNNLLSGKKVNVTRIKKGKQAAAAKLDLKPEVKEKEISVNKEAPAPAEAEVKSSWQFLFICYNITIFRNWNNLFSNTFFAG